jgi:hypothetical protein
MSESPSARRPPAPAAPSPGLATQVADAVVATPGVARLVPGLKSTLARLSRTGGAQSGADGVTVVEDGDTLRVTVDVAVRPTAVVVDTAKAVRAAAADVVGSTHDGPSVVRVNVLAWEPERRVPATSTAPTAPTVPQGPPAADPQPAKAPVR